MIDLVVRAVKELGEYEDGIDDDGKAAENFYQWLVLECGHKVKAQAVLATMTYKVGTDAFCKLCAELKKEIRADLIMELKRTLSSFEENIK